MLFKLPVNEAIMSNLVAFYFNPDEDGLKKLRTLCINDVKETKGEIDFQDALRFQCGANE